MRRRYTSCPRLAGSARRTLRQTKPMALGQPWHGWSSGQAHESAVIRISCPVFAKHGSICNEWGSSGMSHWRALHVPPGKMVASMRTVSDSGGCWLPKCSARVVPASCLWLCVPSEDIGHLFQSTNNILDGHVAPVKKNHVQHAHLPCIPHAVGGVRGAQGHP